MGKTMVLPCFFSKSLGFSLEIRKFADVLSLAVAEKLHDTTILIVSCSFLGDEIQNSPGLSAVIKH